MPGSGIQLVPDGVTPTDPYTLQNNLASTAPGQGASTIGVTPNGCFTSTNVQDALEEICAGGGGGGPTTADQVSIADAGGYYTSTDVEGALQEVGSDLQGLTSSLNSLTAADVGVVDAGGYYASDDAEGVLQEIGLSIQNINAALGDITASEVSIVDAGGYYTSTDVEGALQEIGTARGAPNGIATLNAFGKVPSSQLQIPDPIYFEGTWDAFNNIPDISIAPNEGATWIVNVAGTTNLGGITDWQVGDWAIFHDGDWFKIDNTASNPVVSVNGYIGAVVLTKSDVGLGNVENTALSTWPGSTNLITLGTITTGTWNGSSIGILYGGTGATNESDARDNLGLTIGVDVQPWSATLDALAAGTYTGSTSITTLGTITTGSIPASLVTLVDAGGYYTSTDVEGALQEIGSAFGTYTGSTSITTLGTITTGTWQGSAIGDAYISSAAYWNAKVNPSRSIGTTAPLFGGGDLSADRNLYMTQADAGHDGYLSQADWLTFSNKVPQTRTINGYALSANITLTKSDIGLGNVENTALSTWPGSTNLVTLGTVATGVWNGTAVGPTYGGTGLTSYALGDTVYASAANTLSKLAGNTTTTKKFLSQTGTGAASAAPVWNDVAAADVSVADAGNYFTGTNVETVLQEIGGGLAYLFLNAGSSTQSLTANTNTITPSSTFHRVSPTGNLTLSSTPSITLGTKIGQLLILYHAGAANSVTLQRGSIYGTKFSSANRNLNAGGILGLIWDGSAWVELFFVTANTSP